MYNHGIRVLIGNDDRMMQQVFAVNGPRFLENPFVPLLIWRRLSPEMQREDWMQRRHWEIFPASGPDPTQMRLQPKGETTMETKDQRDSPKHVRSYAARHMKGWKVEYRQNSQKQDELLLILKADVPMVGWHEVEFEMSRDMLLALARHILDTLVPISKDEILDV